MIRKNDSIADAFKKNFSLQYIDLQWLLTIIIVRQIILVILVDFLESRSDNVRGILTNGLID